MAPTVAIPQYARRRTTFLTTGRKMLAELKPSGRNSISQHKCYVAFGCHVSTHFGYAVSPSRSGTNPAEVYLEPQEIAGCDLSAKPKVVQSRQERDARAALSRSKDSNCAYLGQGFGNQHARHNRKSRKVTGEKWFVHGDSLDSDGANAFLQFHDAVDQEKWIAVGNDRLNLRCVEIGQW